MKARPKLRRLLVFSGVALIALPAVAAASVAAGLYKGAAVGTSGQARVTVTSAGEISRLVTTGSADVRTCGLRRSFRGSIVPGARGHRRSPLRMTASGKFAATSVGTIRVSHRLWHFRARFRGDLGRVVRGGGRSGYLVQRQVMVKRAGALRWCVPKGSFSTMSYLVQAPG